MAKAGKALSGSLEAALQKAIKPQKTAYLTSLLSIASEGDI
jgi:hypothetical protein